MNKILIIGATGMLGKPAAEALLDAGFAVKVLARDTQKAQTMLGDGFEIVAGDVTDKTSLETAIKGCAGVLVSVGGAVDQLSATNVAALCPSLGVEQIVYLSGSTVAEQNQWFPMTAQKLQAEKVIQACGIPYTILCPTWPMEQLPRFVRDGQATLVGNNPPSWHWFAAEDLARMIANAFQTEEALGKRLYIHGPEALTMDEALERYCTALHPEIQKVTVLPIEMAKTIAGASGNQMLGFFADLMAYFEKVGEPGDPAEANRILGAPQITLSAWIEQQAVETAVY